MKHVTFGVSASCFAANMALKKNAEELKEEIPLTSFYIDDRLTGANNSVTPPTTARDVLLSRIPTQKWNSNELSVMSTIPEELEETNKSVAI